MRKIFMIAIILIAGINVQAQFKSASLQAAGLTCAMCTKAINNALEELSFIQSVKSDIKNSAFNISFKEGAAVNIDDIKKAVEDAGFSVAKLKVTSQFNNVKIEKDAHIQIDGKTFHFLNVAPQTLNGTKTITLVDKNFVTAKEFKKYAAASQMACVQTGKAASCCTKEGADKNARIYHVTI